jgi:hypothetical protein
MQHTYHEQLESPMQEGTSYEASARLVQHLGHGFHFHLAQSSPWNAAGSIHHLKDTDQTLRRRNAGNRQCQLSALYALTREHGTRQREATSRASI